MLLSEPVTIRLVTSGAAILGGVAIAVPARERPTAPVRHES